MAARLSIVIPSVGRVHVARAMASVVNAGLRVDDEVILLGDEYDERADHPENGATFDLTLTKELVENWGSPFRYVGMDNGHHCAAHCSLNRILNEGYLTGDYITWIDDDDVYTYGALTHIRRAIEATPDRLHIFRFLRPRPYRLYVPPMDRDVAELTLVSGQCIVLPNRAGWWGEWTDDYCGDFDFIDSTIRKVGAHAVVYHKICIAVGRPVDWDETLQHSTPV